MINKMHALWHIGCLGIFNKVWVRLVITKPDLYQKIILKLMDLIMLIFYLYA